MEIIDIDKIELYNETPLAIALGNFDGVHLAHQTLISQMVKKSRELNYKSSVLIFENHTREIVSKEKPKLLTNKSKKYKILEELGVDIIFVMTFTKELMRLDPESFIKSILVDKINVKSIHVGFDYKFGYKASGNSEDLRKISKEYGIKTYILNPIKKGEVVSSTLIRDYISKGQIALANKFLGRKYTITGKVIAGEKRGRKLGFPTANIYIDENYLLPKEGIYSTNTIIKGKKYLSATNIGKNLTFNGDYIKIENFIIDFNDSIYGETIEIEFNEYIRAEKKFKDSNDLIRQIKEDIEYIRRM